MNTATSLNDIADTFDMFASDQLAMISRYRTKRERDDAKTRADVWQDAARTLRETRIVDPIKAGSTIQFVGPLDRIVEATVTGYRFNPEEFTLEASIKGFVE